MLRSVASSLSVVVFAIVVGCQGFPLAQGGSPAPPVSPVADPDLTSTAVSGQGLRTPMIWTWDRPRGQMASHPNVIEMVRAKSNEGPQATANAICDQILKRKLNFGEVAIVVQNYGMGGGDPEKKHFSRAPALFAHWSDGVAHRPRPGSRATEVVADQDAAKTWWATPWMKYGIDQSKEWMRQFIGQYQRRQALNRRIPNPSRFHFDSEGKVLPYKAGSVGVFTAMKNDPRWSSEPVPGMDGRTMAQLFEEAGRPALQPNREFHRQTDTSWIQWYGGVCNQACDAAMNEAAYRQIRAAWPGVLCSNYNAARYDAVTPERALRRPSGYGMRFRNYGDLQAPEIYHSNEPRKQRYYQMMNTTAAAWAEQTLRASVDSFGGPHRDLTPWILMVQPHNPPELADQIVGVCAELGVRELLVYGGRNEGPTEWNQFLAIVRRHYPDF